jgi:hypothetical protein
VVGEVEGHVAEAGWDQPPQLFALVQTEQLLRAEPQLASTMGLVAGDPSSLTPIAQEPLGDAPLDEQLASLVFGDEVLGVVLAHEVLVLPPAAETALADVDDPAAAAAEHPERRDVRMAVGRHAWRAVRRACCACAVRRPSRTSGLTGPDLVPRLAAALLATLEEA